MRERETRRSIESDAPTPPRLALRHGQTVWLLSELGFRQGVSGSTFNDYIKSLRRLGFRLRRAKASR
jgi:hypothetical protein